MYNPYNQIVNPQQQFGMPQQNNQFQQMIVNGQFGQTMPPNNILPFGNDYQNNYYQPMINNQINNYVPEQYKYYQEPKFDYYNPWGASINNQYQPINYGMQYQQPFNYGYNSMIQQPYFYQVTEYQNQPYNTQYQNYIREQQYGYRVLYNMVNKYNNKGWTEEDIDNMLNPKPKENKESFEEIMQRRESAYLNHIINSPAPNEYNCSIIRNHMKTMRNLVEFHKNYDRHSMYEFLCKDLPEIFYGFWIEENCNPNITRDLSQLYNSNDYNELLKMHRSGNPYMNEILDTSRYDNNLDDNEMGIELAFQRAKRKADLLEGRISSEEKMRRRELMTQEIINMMRSRGNKNV